MAQLAKIKKSLFRALLLQPQEDFAKHNKTEFDYEIYRFNAYHKHLKDRLLLLRILSRSSLLTLSREQREQMKAVVKAGLEMVTAAADAKNYFLNKSCLPRCDYPRLNNSIALRELSSLLNAASNALVPVVIPIPGLRTEAVLSMNIKSQELRRKLEPNSSEKLLAALEIFGGSVLAAVGVLLIAMVAVSLLTLNFGTLFMVSGLASAAFVIGGMEVKRGYHFFAGATAKTVKGFNEHMQDVSLSELQWEISSQLRRG